MIRDGSPLDMSRGQEEIHVFIATNRLWEPTNHLSLGYWNLWIMETRLRANESPIPWLLKPLPSWEPAPRQRITYPLVTETLAFLRSGSDPTIHLSLGYWNPCLLETWLWANDSLIPRVMKPLACGDPALYQRVNYPLGTALSLQIWRPASGRSSLSSSVVRNAERYTSILRTSSRCELIWLNKYRNSFTFIFYGLKETLSSLF
jgi:hypothetical protein